MMRFRQALETKPFVVTMDAIPPKGTDLSRLLRALEPARGRVDAVNVTDMPSAVMRLGSLPVCRVLLENEWEPILQMTCRDRNRLALQSDLLGAAVLGVDNVLVLGGDQIACGDHPAAKAVFDVDSVGLLAAARALERGVDMAGNALSGCPDFCLGAAADPNAPSLEVEITEMETKAAAGARFFQTQPVFDLDSFARFTERTRHLGAAILAGVFLLRSARMARFMNDHVPEVVIPPRVIERMDASGDPERTGLEIAAEVIRGLPGLCSGVHIMTINSEHRIPALLDLAAV